MSERSEYRRCFARMMTEFCRASAFISSSNFFLLFRNMSRFVPVEVTMQSRYITGL